MRKNKKKRRAQRKFAQGAFIPPQNNASTSALFSPTPHAHRAGSVPGPVMLNGCTAQDLLTRTSLGKAHEHIWLPVVSLESDYGKINSEASPKKKIKERKNIKLSTKKKRNILRNRRKISSNLPNTRRVSVSDSGEDTPLSYLSGSRMLIAPNVTAVVSAVVKEPSPKVASVVVEEPTASAIMEEMTLPSIADIEETHGGVSSIHLRKRSSLIPVILSVDTGPSKPEYSTLHQIPGLLRKNTHSSNQSRMPSNCKMLVEDVADTTPKHATELSPSLLTSPRISNKRTSSGSKTGHEQTREGRTLTATSRKSQRLKRTTKPYQDKEYLYAFSDMSSIASRRQPCASKSGDPDFLPKSAIASVTNLKSQKFRAVKGKGIINSQRNKVKRQKTESKLTTPRNCAPQECEVDNITMPMEAHDQQPSFSKRATKPYQDKEYLYDFSDLSSLASHQQPCASKSGDPDFLPNSATASSTNLTSKKCRAVKGAPLNTTNMSNDQTAEWVRTHYYQRDMPRKTVSESRSFVPGSSSFMASRSSSITAFSDESIIAPESSSAVPCALTLGHPVGAGNHFKMPELPARFAKLTKNCPTRFIRSLQDLLNSHPTKKDSFCNLCRRCELLSKYKKVARLLPISVANEPDILEMPPHDVYEFDSDEEGIKVLRRGRELVLNVLTTKRFPIWLSNLEMNLKKTMFKDEHKLGTLKRNITFEKDDVTDALVNKVITRVDYLARCIAEDKKELDLERSRQRLRSSKRAQSSSDQRRKVLRPRRKVMRLRRNPGQPAPAAASTMHAEDSMNPPAEASSSETRHLVVRLTPLEVVPELAEHSTPLEDVSQRVERSTPLEDDWELEGRMMAVEDVRVLVERMTPLQDVPKLDPIAYIEKIEAKASEFGICKIIPPKGFNIPCHLDNSCMFTTINQYLGRLYQRWGKNTREMTTIQTYLDGVELDLVKLYHLVLEEGGIEELLAHRETWARIAEQMSLVSPRGKPDPKKLEKLYCKHVLPRYSRRRNYDGGCLFTDDRKIIRNKVDHVWKNRVKVVTRRAKRPLHDKRRMLGETVSDDDEDLDSDNETREVRTVGKPCFDRAEECTGTHKGRPMNLATFRRIAAQIQAMRFPNEPAPSTEDVEEKYWSILSLSNEHVCVLSAFIDTSVDSLGHPADPAAPGGSHPWNLKRLSENPRNILRSLGKTLSVTVPTLCLNQLYAVAQSGAAKFRCAVEVLIPSAVQNKGIWLTSDTTMIPPGMLLAQGVPLRRLEQQPGEFIVVFPGAYASSIATGLTISECIYFESKRWLYNIDSIFQAMQQDCEPAMFSSTLLLLRMAREPTLSLDILRQVLSSIKKLLVVEFDCRRKAIKFKCRILLDQSDRSDGEQAPVSWPNQEECSICRAPLILSTTCRYNDPRSVTCLEHGLALFNAAGPDECAKPPPVTLLYSNQELQAIVDALERRVIEAASPFSKDKVTKTT
ncbi:ARID/BRIGHT DNA binding protein [Operophtera brumata]|uniref:ARID/BRIGHT DNA binding protein n=1 Tax=Operophtera brumata TaxID=104452 RepID=A0A0L7LEV6_OPEBR|nr:ARID/BRIGHT DNA binding protein [Operophtera brumata]